MAEDPRLKDPIQLSVSELYKAVNGAGLPDEVPSSATTVEALLLAHRVKKVEVDQIGKKVYLHEVHLDNGSTLHLAAGTRGALVLKITKES